MKHHLVLAPLLALASLLPAQTIASKTAGMKHMDGYLPLDWDAKTGKLYLEVTHLDTDILYTHSLPYGTGSNDLGLDRGQISRGEIVRFQRTGPKVLLVEPNQFFRASTTDPGEQLAVRQSFPESVLFGFKVEAEDPSGGVLVDATDFFLRDAHEVVPTLARAQQGAYRLDATRSTIALDNTRDFPENTEVEAVLTFTSDGGRAQFVRDVAPDPHALTVREHQSLIQLPGPGFTPRRFDPRAGYFPTTYRDYSVPVSDQLDQQFIIRHRLVKKDPNCKTACEAVTPIHYYVDNGAAEPLRTALLEGARWWDQAFQAAGWAPGTFRADILPAGADPMDIRYNMIQWVHRYTRGWSYGAAVVDPRTGEIIKGNVTLGSLRSRQDYLIDEAYLSPYFDGKPLPPASDPMLAMVLARTRQLAAHETGHTLGLAHNFAASTFPHSPDETMSVMEYPHPWITLDKGGVPDLSHAYPINIGIWDKVTINYGYREFDAGGRSVEDPAALTNILEDSQKTGMIYITDEDSRPLGGAHPHAHLWDNGTDPADELNRIIGIRTAALKRFGENAITTGTPYAQLEDTLVPLYLAARYQVEAASKEIGGLDYRYALRGDGQLVTKLVSPEDQRKALNAVLKTLAPNYLTLPEPLLKILPPRPPGLERTRESFASHTGLTFDPVAAAESSADLTLALLFNPERASRLIQYHARDPQEPSLGDVIDQTLAAARPSVASASPSNLTAVVESAVYIRAVEALLGLAANPQASSEARGVALTRLALLKQQTGIGSPTGAYIAHRITEFQSDPSKFIPAPTVVAPDGMPIGDDEADDEIM